MSEPQETRKPNRFRITSVIIAIALAFIFAGPFMTDIAPTISATPTTISATETTTIFMTAGTQNHTMTNVTADGYATQSFPAQTTVTTAFLSYVSFVITISTEKYYQFKLWTGDLGTETNDSRVMLKIGDEIVGNKIFDSVGSGNATAFEGHDQQIIVGEVRITPGTHTVKLVNMINESSATYQASEDYIGIIIVPQSHDLFTAETNFLVASDLHYGNDTHHLGVNGNIFLGGERELAAALITQINAMTPKPDFLVVTGDIYGITGPIMGEYGPQLRWIFDNLTIPYYLVPGNHDIDSGHSLELMGLYDDIFPQWTAIPGAVYPGPYVQWYYYKDIGTARYVFLDSKDGANPLTVGQINVTQLTWLDQVLDTDKPTFIFQHEPLVAGGFQYLSNAVAVRAILEKHPNVIADFDGHIHMEQIINLNEILYVASACMSEWPLLFTEVNYYPPSVKTTGPGIDINRIQLDYTNTTRMLMLSQDSATYDDNTSRALGDTAHIQYINTISTTQVGILVNLVFLMFGIGIVVGVVAEGTNSLRKMQMRTTEQMVKSLLNMVIYIVIGMASLGIMYSMV